LASAKTNPAQTACTSKANPRSMPKPACTIVAQDGKVRSGVDVATITASMSSGASPAMSSAARAAATAIWLVVSPSAAKCRRSMPDRERIHSSVVSSVFSNSAFSTTRAGR
jgi:hypothetical protein